MDSRSKQQVKDDLIAHLQTRLAAGTSSTAQQAAAGAGAPDERRVDDDSQRGEAGDLHDIFGRADAQERLDLKEARSLDVSERDVVGPGAIVELDGQHYVIGVPTDAFESRGITYEGMATDAPIYDLIHGLRAGDTFTFGGQDQTITSVD